MALFGFGKKKKEEQTASCSCQCGCSAPGVAPKSGAAIQVMVTGCASCHTLLENTREAVGA